MSFPVSARRTAQLAIAMLMVTLAAVLAQGREPARAMPASAPVHQLRVYEIFDETRDAFHRRFRDHAMRIMGRHGFRVLATRESRRAGQDRVRLPARVDGHRDDAPRLERVSRGS